MFKRLSYISHGSGERLRSFQGVDWTNERKWSLVCYAQQPNNLLMLSLGETGIQKGCRATFLGWNSEGRCSLDDSAQIFVTSLMEVLINELLDLNF